MNEVSGRFAKWVFEAGLDDGVDEVDLIKGLSVGWEVLAAGKQRIDWDDYVQMIENYYSIIGLEGMAKSAYKFGTSGDLGSYGKMAGLFFSPRKLYSFMYRWVGNHFLRNVQFRLEDQLDGKLKVTSEIDAASRGSEIYFKTVINVLAGSTLRINRGITEVECRIIDDHHAEYLLTLPKRGSGIAWTLAWPLRRWRARRSKDEIFIVQQDEIRAGQSAIDRQQRDFAELVDGLPDPMLILGGDGRVLFVNSIARDWFLVSKDCDKWQPEQALVDGEQERWAKFLAESDPDPGGHVAEFSFSRSDLGGAVVQLAFQPPQAVAFASQEAKLVVGRDVTERRQLESKMRKVAFEERNRLAGEIHDGLAQQLTGILMRGDIVAKKLEGSDPENAGQVVLIAEMAREAADQARSLAHGLSAADERPDNVRRGLANYAKKLRLENGLEVELDLPGNKKLSAPGQQAFELLRIVQEASHNAMKHSGSKRIRISLEDIPGAWILRVSDYGAGFSEPGDGVGIGLKSMKYRAGQIGANLEIGARSDGQAGGEVRVTFPLEAPVPAESDPLRGAESGAPGGRTLRLLVADDQRVVLDALVARLGMESDMVVCAQVAERDEIIPEVLEHKPDVLVIDMLMDGEDNLEVIRVLRNQMPELRIVVMTMFAAELYENDSINAGADAYVVKDVDSAELVDVIQKVYRLSSADQAQPAGERVGSIARG